MSYYAPPLNAITSMRAYTLGVQLAQEHEVHIVTRFWSGSEKTWEDMLESTHEEKTDTKGNLHIHYRPYNQPILKTNWIGRKMQLLCKWSKGEFNPEIDCSEFEAYADSLLTELDFSAIYTTSPPINIIKSAHRLAIKNELPLIADFRDLMNHIILKKNSSRGLGQKIEMHLLKRFLKKTLVSPSVTVTAASEPFVEWFKDIGVEGAVLLLNGYEKSLTELSGEPPSDKFTLSLLGTVYMHQEKSILRGALASFLKRNADSDVQVNFIGLNAIPNVADYFKAELNDPRVCITDKIERSAALKTGKQSHVLFYMGWPGHRGMYSGKIFEYIGLKRRILIAPGDGDALDSLIKKTGSGVVTNTEDETLHILESWYQEWKSTGRLPLEEVNIEEFSRERQNSKLIQIIERL